MQCWSSLRPSMRDPDGKESGLYVLLLYPLWEPDFISLVQNCLIQIHSLIRRKPIKQKVRFYVLYYGNVWVLSISLPLTFHWLQCCLQSQLQEYLILCWFPNLHQNLRFHQHTKGDQWSFSPVDESRQWFFTVAYLTLSQQRSWLILLNMYYDFQPLLLQPWEAYRHTIYL